MHIYCVNVVFNWLLSRCGTGIGGQRMLSQNGAGSYGKEIGVSSPVCLDTIYVYV